MTTSKKFEQVISVVVICSTSSSSKKAMENNFKLNATKNLENSPIKGSLNVSFKVLKKSFGYRRKLFQPIFEVIKQHYVLHYFSTNNLLRHIIN